MRSSRGRDLLVFLGFTAISFAYFGWRLLPHPGRVFVGTGQDPLIFIWSFAWWPHALLHGENPFVTHALDAPSGANLAWSTSVPGLALAFAPLTLAFGPVVSFNMAALLLPALAAWSAYRLCLVLSGSRWGSLFGGYVFGFSSFVLAQQLQGHLNLTGVFCLPLLALAVVRFVRGEISGRSLIVRVGLLVALQLSISTEFGVTATLMLALGLVLAYALVPGARRAVEALLRPLVLGYGLAAILVSPLIVYAVLGFARQGFSGAGGSGTDLVDLVVPTEVNGLAGTSFSSLQQQLNAHESAIFLGWPVLAVVALYAWHGRRSAWARFLVVSLVVALLLAIGSALRVDGHRVASLPWTLARYVPVLDNIHTTRFAAYAALAAAAIVALWTAQTKGRVFRRPYALPLLSVAALVPAVWHPYYVSHPSRPAFFSRGLDAGCIRGETVLAFPFGFGGDSMLWQAEAGFEFRLAEGYLSPIVLGAKPLYAFDDNPTVYAFDFLGDRGLPTMNALLAFASSHGVARLVAPVLAGYPSRRQLEAFGPVEEIGDVYVAPACGRPPLTSRPLSPAAQQTATMQAEGITIGYCHSSGANGEDYYALPAGLYPANLLAGARLADYIAGQGLGCVPPPGFSHHGFAPANLGVPADIYPYYTS